MWLKIQNHRGFYIAELLLSLSCLILMASLFVPMLVQLHKQSVQIQERQNALHILYEYMQGVVVEQKERENLTVTKGKKQYEIIWQDSEVLIQYEDAFGKTVQLQEHMES